MSNSKLIELSYYDPSAQVRLSVYADTLVLDHDQNGSIISAIRFGGYPEMVRAMADAIYGGATIEAAQNDTTRMLQSSLKSYQRQITHDGIYAVATLMAADTVQEDDRSGKHEKDEDTNLVDTEQMELQPRRCYIFCPAGDQRRLFEELDRKTAAPLIPEFQDYVLNSLRQRGDLRQLEVISQKERMDAWVLDLKPQDQNVVEVLEQGLQSGDIQIPGAVPNMPDGFENVENVTGYLNTFGVTVADRIRNQFMPLFDPAKEPLSDEVLAINDCIMSRVGYSLYDAQLAVAEAVKRQLARKRVALIIAECGSGKTKIGSTALGALHGLWAAQKRKGGGKSFGIVMCPSHVTQKWVREIGETLPDTYGMVVRTIQDLNRLYAMYEEGDKSVFAVFSKEQARDGYMRYPAVRWNRHRRAFLCPDCDGVIEMEISEDGSRYMVPADQFFFQKEHKKNHTCPHCGKVNNIRGMALESQEEFDAALGDGSKADNLVLDDAVDVQGCCRKAEELFELYQRCANRKQIETICVNFLRGMEATKLSVTGHMYFVPRTFMERVDIFEDFITLLSGLNKKQTPLVVNSFYIIDDAKQRDKMTEEFYLAVKKEIAAYQEKCDYLIKSSSQSPAVMERWVLKVQALEEKKRHYEGVLQRELDGLDDEFSVLKLLSQELQVRARSIRSQRFQQRAA